MTQHFMPIRTRGMNANAGYTRPYQELPERVRLTSPAVLCMTDLRLVTPVTVAPQVPIRQALEQMIVSGVRLLLVTQDQNRLLGLITSTDIQGEKPLRLMHDRNMRFDEILVHEIMTTTTDLEVIEIEDIRRATVGNLVATMERSGRRHALVVEPGAEGGDAIRGIISATQLSRQLGTTVEPMPVATTFAEVESALIGG